MDDTRKTTIRRGLRLWWFVLLVLILLLAVRFWMGRGPAGRQGSLHPAVGKRLETISLQPLIGAERPLSADNLRGKVALINFWGPWCPPCRTEFPELYKLRQSLGGREGFEFISVSSSPADGDQTDLEKPTRKFLSEQKADLPIYRDAYNKTRYAFANAAASGQFLYPTTVVLDGGGTIRGVWAGYEPGDEQQMHALINSLLHRAASGPSAPQ